MKNISSILIPFNFKESALNAINYTMSFSKKTESTSIVLLYVLDGVTEGERDKVEPRLSEIINSYSSINPRIKMSYLFESGSMIDSIIQKRKELGSDIVIMGTKGRVEESSKLNTNTSELIRQADFPVIVVPKSYTEFELNNITLAIEKCKLDEPDILTNLLVIARRFNAKIHVLTVYDENDKDFLKDRENESTLEYYFERYYATSTITQSSNIAESIIDYDAKRSIDMLAIIPHHHSKNEDQSEGRLAQYFTINTNIPILILD